MKSTDIVVFGGNELDKYREWLKANHDGYVWNVGHSTLHAASCRFINPGGTKGKPANSEAKKACSPTLESIIAKYPKAKDAKSRCGTCNP